MLANCAKAHLMSSSEFLKLRSGPLRRAVIINFFRWLKHLRSAPNPIVTAPPTWPVLMQLGLRPSLVAAVACRKRADRYPPMPATVRPIPKSKARAAIQRPGAGDL
jgi:hypothetical protein